MTKAILKRVHHQLLAKVTQDGKSIYLHHGDFVMFLYHHTNTKISHQYWDVLTRVGICKIRQHPHDISTWIFE